MRKVLFVTSECYPLIKTGGLGDVSASLSRALATLGEDMRILMPAYRDAVGNTANLQTVARFSLAPSGLPVQILEGRFAGSPARFWLVDYPPAYDRPGNPYLDHAGLPWPDNAPRFALLGRVAAAIALGTAGLNWRPDIVHGNDWQAGLALALTAPAAPRPALVFTIHNLAYQGLFPAEVFTTLQLPPDLWTPAALEFHGQLSFIKGGLVFADRISTVSPTYAREIQTPEYGYGLEGLLQHRRDRLSGILNGIDDQLWNPEHDPHLVSRYAPASLSGKAANTRALQEQLGLPQDPGVTLAGMVGRLVHQKGIDLVLDALPELLQLPLQLVILGNGEGRYEQAIQTAARLHPQQLAAIIGYDESLAHRIEAGAELFIMPSHFEPCGLNQLYSLRYGAVPVVRRVGGLADSVLDATPEGLDAGRATGFVFDEATPEALVAAVRRALKLRADRKRWLQLQRAGMSGDYSWQQRAGAYQKLYDQAQIDCG